MDYDKLYGDPKGKPSNQLKPFPPGLSEKDTFKAMMPEAISALRRVLNDSDASDSATISAVTALMDRAIGKQAASAGADADTKLEVTIMRQCPGCGAIDAGK